MAESLVARRPDDVWGRTCECMADGVRCRMKAQGDDVLCKSCREHHVKPFGPNDAKPAGARLVDGEPS